MTVTSMRWIFGYGSLIWRPAFAAIEQHPAYIVHWARRFWQGSTDHRGLPGAPGRVVTLVSAPGARTWGIAYLVANEAYARTLSELDHREKGGYERDDLDVHFADGRVERALVYRATPDNENYLGPASLPEIAAQVKRSRGPSGDNVEYVLRLAQSLRSMDAHDEHVEALAELLVEPQGPFDQTT